MMRRVQWSIITSQILIIAIISLFLIPIFANGLNNNTNEDEDDEFLHDTTTLELLHRHHPRFSKDGDEPLDKFEAMKGCLYRDSLRRSMINQRMGVHHSSSPSSGHRRMDIETIQMPIHSGKDYGIGEYMVEIEVGTPHQKTWLVADSGNDLTWFHCRDTPDTLLPSGGVTLPRGGVRRQRNHKRTHKRKFRSRSRSVHRSWSGSKTKRTTRTRTRKPDLCHRVYCPKRSSSFQLITCLSPKCMFEITGNWALTHCPTPADPCLYAMSYADTSQAHGYFATETLTVGLTTGKKTELHGVTIGCTKRVVNSIVYNNKFSGGILGLGFAKNAFIDKAATKYGRGKFSFCLVDHMSHRNVTSYLTFGSQNVKIFGEMQQTQLLMVPPYYGVIAVGISVGGEMLKIPPHVWDFDNKGGVIIDTGTTVTGLVTEAFDAVAEAFDKALANVRKVTGDFGGTNLCYSAEGFNMSSMPRLAIHFVGGAKFEPPVKSYVIDIAEGVKCLGITKVKAPAACVIGNIMQQNHVWEYDLNNLALKFAPSTCTTP